jgi:hypothetical protein
VRARPTRHGTHVQPSVRVALYDRGERAHSCLVMSVRAQTS